MKFYKKLAMLIATSLIVTGTMTSCSSGVSKDAERYKYKNLIDVTGVPTKAKPNDSYEINPFSDMGAWHGYHLPNLNDKEYYGGFTGPLYIAEEYGVWLSKCFNKIKIYDSKSGNEIKLSDCKNADLAYYPGLLKQKYEMDDFSLILELRFVTNRTALVTTKIENNKDEELNLKIKWNGELLKYKDKNNNIVVSNKLEGLDNGIKVKFSDVNEMWSVFTSKEMAYEVKYPMNVNTVINGEEYSIELPEFINIKGKKSYTINTTNTYTFTEKEKVDEDKKTEDILKNPDKYIKENDVRWNKYIDKTVKSVNKEYINVAIKAIQTLTTNWRSAAGNIKSEGVTPSMSYVWFNGMWAWDSWKQAVAVCNFNPDLAKNNIKAMFDYQDENGMVVDAIFYNKNAINYSGEKGGNWNERNSKPPLAAWAVWKVYEETGDKDFLKEMYPKLVKYHEWWYTHRDNDKNGILEYGATVDKLNSSSEEIIQAAAWESGMDNAVRFDEDFGVKVIKNLNSNDELVGYSINQESVDLNSYFYAEKKFLANIAREINKKADSKKYEEESKKIKDFIQKYMFDSKEGFFFDVDINTKKTLSNRGKGTEGLIPLWAGVASKEQAELVKNIIMDENKFNTKVPIPTASKDNKRYNSAKYWRGPVWLDQAYFAIEGLNNYGYKDEAKNLAKKILDNVDGIKSGNKTFRENYNSLTGEGLHCTNFSWTAGMMYLLCKEYIDK